MDATGDRSFAEVRPMLDLWKEIEKTTDLSTIPPEIIARTTKNMGYWLEGFIAGMAFQREEQERER